MKLSDFVNLSSVITQIPPASAGFSKPVLFTQPGQEPALLIGSRCEAV